RRLRRIPQAPGQDVERVQVPLEQRERVRRRRLSEGGQAFGQRSEALPLLEERREAGALPLAERCRLETQQRDVEFAEDLPELLEVAAVAGDHVLAGVLVQLRDAAELLRRAGEDARRDVGQLVARGHRLARHADVVHEHADEDRALHAERPTQLGRDLHFRVAFAYEFNLLRIVFTSSPSWRAASALLLPTRSSVWRMGSRSASASVVPSGSISVGEPPGFLAWRYGGKCEGSIQPDCATITARSITLRSSRTFPGQACDSSSSCVTCRSPSTCIWCFRLKARTKWCARSGR